jgi:hypothetical protein
MLPSVHNILKQRAALLIETGIYGPDRNSAAQRNFLLFMLNSSETLLISLFKNSFQTK